MAIGGNITLTTQAVARYIPSMTKPESHHGAPMAAAPDLSTGTVQSMSSVASMPDGTLAPAMVSQNTPVSMAIISGTPHSRLVTSRSMVRSRSKRRPPPGRVTARSAIRAASV